MPEETFIGVDLAWQSERNHTGIAVLRGSCAGARLVAVSSPVHSASAALEFVSKYAVGKTIVAVDAPLIVRNHTGQRPCETAVGRRYGARDASCHTSNLRLYPNPGSVRFADGLAAQGFVHAPAVEGAPCDRIMLEIYPHAGMVALFDLERCLKYKKGTLATKRAGLATLRDLLRRLHRADPPLNPSDELDQLLSQDLAGLPGKPLKQYEDSLDALFAAYLGLLYGCGGLDKCEVFGDTLSGYIVNPRLVASGIGGSAA